MFDTFMDHLKKALKSRLLPLAVIYFALFSVLVYRLFQIQVVKQEEIIDSTEEQESKEREIKATRGNIYDVNGVLLAYNELSYTVTLEDTGSFENNDERNEMIYKLIQIIEKNGNELATEFSIKQNKKGALVFNVDGTAEQRFKKNAYARKSVNELTEEEKNASPEEVYEFLRQGNRMFGISDQYSVEDTLKIMNVRYAMFMNTYSKYLPITVASAVDDRTVASIKENSPDLPGVQIEQETHRVYNDSVYFAHMLGYTGLISESELESDGQKYYSATDQIGKTGLERMFEDYLNGTKGKEVVAISSKTKRVTEVLDTTDPEAGTDLYLTIDSELQKASYHILERDIAAILLSRIHSGTDSGGKGVQANKITIPINDVYYALINNNIIDIKRFEETDAADLEKSAYAKYKNKEKGILTNLRSAMGVNSKTALKSASLELQDYLTYMYEFLIGQEFLIKDNIDSKDSTYISYADDKISLSQFLQYAISNNWVNLSKIGVKDNYYSTEELYDILLEKAFALLPEDRAFNKMIYKTLVYTYQLSGRDICLLLYDQGVLEYDENDVGKLKNGVVSSYSFIRDKIEKLEITPAQLALDPCSGSIVITDVKTGKVKALVSYPSYDNNKLANKIDTEYYNWLMTDLTTPSLNRPVQQKTAPGSCYKMVTAAAALEENVMGLFETVHDDVLFTKQDTNATCASNRSHGDVDVREALEVSCNYYFFEAGYRLSIEPVSRKFSFNYGLERLKKYASMFGLNETSGVELNEYAPQISDTDSIRSAIGQGSNSYTPTQIARFTSAIANGGTCNYLTIVDHLEDINGKKIKNTVSANGNKKAPVIQLKDSTWSAIKDGMYRVLNGPKGSLLTSKFGDVPVTVAGKTSTAQISKFRGNHTLLTSYAPYEDPEIDVTVAIPYSYTSSNILMCAADIYKYYYGNQDLKDVMEGSADASHATDARSTRTND